MKKRVILAVLTFVLTIMAAFPTGVSFAYSEAVAELKWNPKTKVNVYQMADDDKNPENYEWMSVDDALSFFKEQVGYRPYCFEEGNFYRFIMPVKYFDVERNGDKVLNLSVIPRVDIRKSAYWGLENELKGRITVAKAINELKEEYTDIVLAYVDDDFSEGINLLLIFEDGRFYLFVFKDFDVVLGKTAYIKYTDYVQMQYAIWMDYWRDEPQINYNYFVIHDDVMDASLITEEGIKTE